MRAPLGFFATLFAIISAFESVVAEQSAAAKAFEKVLYDRIGTDWYNRVQNHADELRNGVVTVSLTLAPDGAIRDLHVVSNTSKQKLSEDVVLDSVRHAKLPAPPAELLRHGVFQTDLGFKIFPNKTADTKQVMPPINYYGLDTSLKTVEHGVVTKEEAIEVVDKFAAMQVGLQGTAEEVVSKSMFGFSIDEKRFIEIAMETDKKFRVKLEMPGRLFGIYQKEITIEGLPALHDIVEHFFTMPLEDFKNYFETVR